jgi:Raf kinase inhibitor-like YbhB/YbcL family protein
MPEPGSHAYDVRRRELRDQYDQQGVPDKNATQAANEELQGGARTGSRASSTDRVDGPLGERGGGGQNPGAGIALRTSAFSDHDMIPARYSKDGDNVPPVLEWSGVPDGTVELVLLCEDPDAPGGTYLHWLVTGIDPSATAISESEPAGATAWTNGYGERGYGGPQPPVGDDAHRYFFRLYALGSPFDLPVGTGLDEVKSSLEDKALAAGTTVGLFAR